MSSTPVINPYGNANPNFRETSAPDANAQGVSNGSILGDLSAFGIMGLLVRAGYGSGNSVLSAEKALQAMLEDVARVSKLQPADTVYGDRMTAPGASSRAEMPTTEPTPGDHRIINQGAYKGRGTLGNGSSTLSGAACALASTTMMANSLTGSNRDLLQANATARNAGAFAAGSSDMSIETGARSMGLQKASSRLVANEANVDSAIHQMQRGNPPTQMIAGVDYKGDSGTDHFIHVHSVGADGRLRATDPAGGRQIEFERRGSNWVEVRPPSGAPYHGYTLTNFQLYSAANQSLQAPPRPIQG